MSKRSQSWVRELLANAVVLGVILLGRASFADQYTVPSGSMLPTVQLDDRIAVDKRAFGLRLPLSDHWLVRYAHPRKGEVVVLDSPDQPEVLLKRVAAVAGDRVEVRAGQIWINGQAVPFSLEGAALLEHAEARTHIVSLEHGGGPAYGPVVVPPGQVLVLGDNRGDSRDGRYFGLVPEDTILGRAWGVFWRGGRPAWQPL